MNLSALFKGLKGLKGKYNKNQYLFILDAILINASIVLTSGVFISGYIVLLKGSDFLVGILNSSANWASIVALFSFVIYERMRRRKKLLLTLIAFARIFVCSIAFLPLIFKDNQAVLYTASVMVIAGNILWGIYAIGWTVWMISVLPKEMRNEYIYARTLYLRISFTIVTIVMGFVLDWFNKTYTGFLIVFCAALVLSITDIIILSRIEEPENHVNGNHKFNPAMFWEPVKNEGYRGFLFFIFLFYAAIQMAASYSPLYLIKYIRLDYGVVSTINVVMYTGMIASTQFWRRVESKRGVEFVFRTTSIFIAAEFLIYSFLVRERFYLLFFSPIIAGIGNGGFNVCLLTHRYELMPEENRTVYEGWFGAVFGLSTLIGPLVGGVLLQKLPVIGNALYRYGNFQLLYLLAFLLAVCVILFFFFGPEKFRIGKGTVGRFVCPAPSLQDKRNVPLSRQ